VVVLISPQHTPCTVLAAYNRPPTCMLLFHYVARFRNTRSDVVARAGGGASGKLLEGIREGHLRFLAKQTATPGTLTHNLAISVFI
jgi:hypothetical protein